MGFFLLIKITRLLIKYQFSSVPVNSSVCLLDDIINKESLCYTVYVLMTIVHLIYWVSVSPRINTKDRGVRQWHLTLVQQYSISFVKCCLSSWSEGYSMGARLNAIVSSFRGNTITWVYPFLNIWGSLKLWYIIVYLISSFFLFTDFCTCFSKSWWFLSSYHIN